MVGLVEALRAIAALQELSHQDLYGAQFVISELVEADGKPRRSIIAPAVGRQASGPLSIA